MSIQVTHTASRIGATALLAASLCIGALRAQDQGAQKPADAPQAPAATQQPAQSADTTRATLERWVEARKQSSKARSDWRVEKESLQERVDIVRRQIATLKERQVIA